MVNKFCFHFDLRSGIIGYGYFEACISGIFLTLNILALDYDKKDFQITGIIGNLLGLIVAAFLIYGAEKYSRGWIKYYLIIQVISMCFQMITLLLIMIVNPFSILSLPFLAIPCYIYYCVYCFYKYLDPLHPKYDQFCRSEERLP